MMGIRPDRDPTRCHLIFEAFDFFGDDLALLLHGGDVFPEFRRLEDRVAQCLVLLVSGLKLLDQILVLSQQRSRNERQRCRPDTATPQERECVGTLPDEAPTE